MQGLAIAATTAPAPSAAAPQAASGKGGVTFGEVLSCLNPLQYLPVVGTIYRAVTGDTIPEPIREAGSLVVSGLTGGPVGVATSLGMDLAERALGIDTEAIGQHVLAFLGIGHGAPHAAAPAAGPPPAALATAAGAVTPFTAAELAAAPGGSADALNGLELGRLAAAQAAYARVA